MAHPFEKLLYRALKESTDEHNEVTEVLQSLLDKQYPRGEVCTVAKKLKQSLIDSRDEALVGEALEAVCAGVDED